MTSWSSAAILARWTGGRFEWRTTFSSINEFTKVISTLSKLPDSEVRHVSMDKAIADLLRAMGYIEAMEIYEKTEKWYA